MSVHLTKQVLEGVGHCNLGGKVIYNAKYAHDLELLAKEKTVLEGITDKLNETGRCYGMEMNVEKKRNKQVLSTIVPMLEVITS
jgi:hypothetical protein